MAYVRFYPGAAPVKQDHISEVFAVFFQIARALFSSHSYCMNICNYKKVGLSIFIATKNISKHTLTTA